MTTTCKISLRITHPTMTSDELSRVLGREPRIFRSVGMPRLDSSGNVIGYNSGTFCTFNVIEAQGALHSALLGAIDDISGVASDLLEIENSGGTLELYAGVFSEGVETSGFTISPHLVKQLAALNIALTVETYW